METRTIEIETNASSKGATSYVVFDGQRDLSTARTFAKREDGVRFFEGLAAQRYMHMAWEVAEPKVIGRYV